MRVRVKYFTNKVPELTYIGGKTTSDWVDLCSAEDVSLKSGEFKLIPLGVAIELPDNFEAHVVPRSSTFKNFGIMQANSFGVIDNSYCGDNDQWMFPAIAFRDTEIHAGDRICQFRIFENQPRLYFIKTDTLGNKDRGGIGSTGV